MRIHHEEKRFMVKEEEIMVLTITSLQQNTQEEFLINALLRVWTD